MANQLEGDALVTQLKDRLAKMDQAMSIMQALREEPVGSFDAPGLDRIIDILQAIRDETADLMEAEISGEDEGVA